MKSFSATLGALQTKVASETICVLHTQRTGSAKQTLNPRAAPASCRFSSREACGAQAWLFGYASWQMWCVLFLQLAYVS